MRYTDIEKDLEVRGGIFLTGISREKLIQIFVRHNVVAVYLFGSQLKGTADPMSDVDIGVVFGCKGIGPMTCSSCKMICNASSARLALT